MFRDRTSHDHSTESASRRSRRQERAIEYLKAENRWRREKLGGQIRLTDSERRRIARLGRAVGPKALGQLASIASPGSERLRCYLWRHFPLSRAEPPAPLRRRNGMLPSASSPPYSVIWRGPCVDRRAIAALLARSARRIAGAFGCAVPNAYAGKGRTGSGSPPARAPRAPRCCLRNSEAADAEVFLPKPYGTGAHERHRTRVGTTIPIVITLNDEDHVERRWGRVRGRG
jgi:hypothetical protein